MSLTLTGFEAIMPVAGFLVESGIGVAVSKVSDYIAAAVLVTPRQRLVST